MARLESARDDSFQQHWDAFILTHLPEIVDRPDATAEELAAILAATYAADTSGLGEVRMSPGAQAWLERAVSDLFPEGMPDAAHMVEPLQELVSGVCRDDGPGSLACEALATFYQLAMDDLLRDFVRRHGGDV